MGCVYVSMIFSYLGTKGGTGTTTLAVNGAADIRRLSRKPTVVVDLKTGPGDVSLFLGLRPRYTVLHAVDHLAWMDPGAVSKYVIHHDCGLHVLAAGEEFGRPAPRDVDGIEQMLRCLNSLYDFVIVDIGSPLSTCGAMALQLSETVLLVANPDVACLRNLQRLIDCVKLTGVGSDRLKIVLNRASEFGALSTAQLERVLGLRIDFSVNSDYRTVASALNAGVPVSAMGGPAELHHQLEAVARALCGVPERRSRFGGGDDGEVEESGAAVRHPR
jgi:pilus assembly protein CpaE